MYRLGRARMAGSANGNEAGFTIIEVLFFLAISGALVVALLATVGFQVSRQRFTDAQFSTQAYFQTEYNSALDVENTRASKTACSLTSGTVTNVGASNCVILGQAIDFTVGSSTLTSYPVLGIEPSAATLALNKTGADLLKEYNPAIDTADSSTYDVSWGATVTGVYLNTTSTKVDRILLLRAPDSGAITTYGGNQTASMTDLLSSGTNTYNVCIKSADITAAVALIALSPVSGAEGVTTKTDGLGGLCS